MPTAFLTHDDLRITERAIPLTRLAPAFDGLRIVQISDLHFYEHTDPAYYARVTEAVLALSPDVLVMTGDVVHFGGHYIANAGAFLGGLRDLPCPRLAVLGNHDYHDDAYGAGIRAMLAEAGFDLLMNESRPLERSTPKAPPASTGVPTASADLQTASSGVPTTSMDLPLSAENGSRMEEGESQVSRLWFAGLDDLYYGQPDIDRALAGIPADEPVIMLAHNPLMLDPLALAWPGRVDLLICGHTHAGHVYIPPLGAIYRKVFRHKYRYGLYEKNGCRMHVTSGVGSAAFYLKKRRIGFPRFRFNTHPEIAVLTLRLVDGIMLFEAIYSTPY